MPRQLYSMFGFKQHESNLVVDYGSKPSLPVGATHVLRHEPAGTGITKIMPRQIELVDFDPGMIHEHFYERNKHRPFCDSLILDALMQLFYQDPAHTKQVIEKYFGQFSGQIFFLGTAYAADDGQECVPYLNIDDYQGHLSYLYPMGKFANHDVTCTTAFFRPDLQ